MTKQILLQTIVFPVLAVSFMLSPILTLAQAPATGPGAPVTGPIPGGVTSGSTPKFTNPLGATATIKDVLINIIRWILGIVGALALLAIIWSGIQFIISVGNDQQLQHAKKSLTWAIIGLIIIFLAFVIVELVGSALSP